MTRFAGLPAAFRAMVAREAPVLVPGAWDPLSARMVESPGFAAASSPLTSSGPKLTLNFSNLRDRGLRARGSPA